MDARGHEVTPDGTQGGSLAEGAIGRGLLFVAPSEGGDEFVGVDDVGWGWSPGPELNVAVDAPIVISDPVRGTGEPECVVELFVVLGDVKSAVECVRGMFL